MTSFDASPNPVEPASQRTTVAELSIPQLSRRTGRIRAPRRDKRRAADAETGWSKPLLWRVVALLVVLLAFVAPRLTELDRMVTPDEPIWLARSANFYEAISSGDLGSTYQFAHPGVTVMWLGAAGYWWKARDYTDRIDGQIPQRLNYIASTLAKMGHDPLDVMVAGRVMIVLALTVVFALSFLYALRLLPFWTAVFGFLIAALDPFPIALSRLYHIDATASYLMLLSVLAGSVYLFRGRKRADLIVSGIAAGLAVLTRSQMGVLAVWFALMLLIEVRNWRFGGVGWVESIRVCVRPLVAWGVAAFLTCLLLWPALWVDPVGTIRGMLDFAETAAIEGHERTVVFAGQLYEGDPGFQFYPASFLWRATPGVVIGIVLALAAVILTKRLGVSQVQRRIAMSLTLAIVSYGLLMTLAAKKFDRYLLPVYPLAALLAAWGLLVVARKLASLMPGPSWAPSAAAVALTLAVLVGGVRGTAPYYLSYYSPMLGGAEAAPDSMMVGWGEGLDQMAAFLNSLPEGSEVVVATEAWPSSLSYFLDEADARIASFVDDPRGAYRWSRSDYYVLYVTSLTRGDIWQPWLQELAEKEPVMTVALNGLEYARLYDIRNDPLPPFLERGRIGMTIWEGLGRMVASTKADVARAVEPGGSLEQTLYFDQLATNDLAVIADRFSVRISLVNAEGDVVTEASGPLQLGESVRHDQYETTFTIDIPQNLPFGTYTLEMEIIATPAGQAVQGFSFLYGDRLAATVALDTVGVVSSEAVAEETGDARD